MRKSLSKNGSKFSAVTMVIVMATFECKPDGIPSRSINDKGHHISTKHEKMIENHNAMFLKMVKLRETLNRNLQTNFCMPP